MNTSYLSCIQILLRSVAQTIWLNIYFSVYAKFPSSEAAILLLQVLMWFISPLPSLTSHMNTLHSTWWSSVIIWVHAHMRHQHVHYSLHKHMIRQNLKGQQSLVAWTSSTTGRMHKFIIMYILCRTMHSFTLTSYLHAFSLFKLRLTIVIYVIKFGASRRSWMSSPQNNPCTDNYLLQKIDIKMQFVSTLFLAVHYHFGRQINTFLRHNSNH